MGETVERVSKDSKVVFWGDFIEPCVVIAAPLARKSSHC